MIYTPGVAVYFTSLFQDNKSISCYTVDHLNTSGVCSDADHRADELEECTTKEPVPYIPYKLATLYIIKVKKKEKNPAPTRNLTPSPPKSPSTK